MAANGKPVNLRAKPDIKSTILAHVPVGDRSAGHGIRPGFRMAQGGNRRENRVHDGKVSEVGGGRKGNCGSAPRNAGNLGRRNGKLSLKFINCVGSKEPKNKNERTDSI